MEQAALAKKFSAEVAPALMQQFKYSSPMAVPRVARLVAGLMPSRKVCRSR